MVDRNRRPSFNGRIGIRDLKSKVRIAVAFEVVAEENIPSLRASLDRVDGVPVKHNKHPLVGIVVVGHGVAEFGRVPFLYAEPHTPRHGHGPPRAGPRAVPGHVHGKPGHVVGRANVEFPRNSLPPDLVAHPEHAGIHRVGARQYGKAFGNEIVVFARERCLLFGGQGRGDRERIVGIRIPQPHVKSQRLRPREHVDGVGKPVLIPLPAAHDYRVDRDQPRLGIPRNRYRAQDGTLDGIGMVPVEHDMVTEVAVFSGRPLPQLRGIGEQCPVSPRRCIGRIDRGARLHVDFGITRRIVHLNRPLPKHHRIARRRGDRVDHGGPVRPREEDRAPGPDAAPHGILRGPGKGHGAPGVHGDIQRGQIPVILGNTCDHIRKREALSRRDREIAGSDRVPHAVDSHAPRIVLKRLPCNDQVAAARRNGREGDPGR